MASGCGVDPATKMKTRVIGPSPESLAFGVDDYK